MKKYVILIGVILIILLGIQQYLIRNSPKKDDFRKDRIFR